MALPALFVALAVSIVTGMVLMLAIAVGRVILDSIHDAFRIRGNSEMAQAQDSIHSSAHLGFDLIGLASDIGTFLIVVAIILTVIAFIRSQG